MDDKLPPPPYWRSLYDITGNISDVNTMAVNLNEVRDYAAMAVREAVERERAAGAPVDVDALMQGVENLFTEGIAQERSGIKDSNVTYRMVREIRAIASGGKMIGAAIRQSNVREPTKEFRPE